MQQKKWLAALQLAAKEFEFWEFYSAFAHAVRILYFNAV